MNWDAIGAIGEIIGAVCVVITLFYLSLQLRQNTSQVQHSAVATEIAAYQDMIGRISDLNALRISDPDLTDLILKGQTDPSSLSENEKSRYGVWIMTLLRHGDMAFFLSEKDVIDQDRAISSMGPLIAAMPYDGFKEVWARAKEGNTFTPGYISFIEDVRRQRDV